MSGLKSRSIFKMSIKEIIDELDLKNNILDYHYYVRNKYHDVSDLYSIELIEHVAEELHDYFQDENIMDIYDGFAIAIIDELEEELVDTIYAMDDEARDYYNDRQSALKGRY